MNTRLLAEAFKSEIITSYRKFAKRNLEKMALISKLKAANIKHDTDTLIEIKEDKQGNVVFLERGNEKAGYKHLLTHLNEFKQKNVTPAIIPKLIMNALVEGEVVGYQGKGKGRAIYRSTFFAAQNDAGFMDIAITVGSNGFVVGANPASKFKR
jgi:hypothetical protein